MNLVKTKLRNRLAVKTLNAILYVRFGLIRTGKCCYSYTVPDDVLRCIGIYTKETYDSDSQSSTSTATVDEDQDIDF